MSQPLMDTYARLPVTFTHGEGPYLFDSDDVKDDVFPSEIRGLVHVLGNLRIDNDSVVRGAVICEGQVTVETSNAQLISTPSLLANPPVGYVRSPASSWTREPAP